MIVDYSQGFRKPEMVKRRLAVVLSPAMAARPHLCTIVPLSTSVPEVPMPFHKILDVPFEIPMPWGNIERWIKGDMVNAVGFHRIDLLRLRKDITGKRIYQLTPLSPELFKRVRRCALHGMGMSTLTKHL